MLELALSLTFLVVLAVGVGDLGRGVTLAETGASLARTGMVAATPSVGNDAWTPVMQEAVRQGLTWTTSSSTMCAGVFCGDPTGCPAASPAWTSPANANACFAIGTCARADGSCGAITWQARPASSAGALVVRIVLRYTASAPIIGNLLGNGGVVDVQRDAYGIPAY